MAICAVSPKCRAWLPVLIDDPALLDAQKLVLADHRPRRLDQRHLQAEGASAEPYWPAVGRDPEAAELHHSGRGCRDDLRAMMVIDIFKENQRFSEQTPHSGPRSVVGAANPGRRSPRHGPAKPVGN